MTQPVRDKTPTHTALPDPEAIHGTPVLHKSSTIQPDSVNPVTGQHAAKDNRTRYMREMVANMAEMKIDEFLGQFMPGVDVPPAVASKISQMDKTALMGNEALVCEQLVCMPLVIVRGHF